MWKFIKKTIKVIVIGFLILMVIGFFMTDEEEAKKSEDKTEQTEKASSSEIKESKENKAKQEEEAKKKAEEEKRKEEEAKKKAEEKKTKDILKKLTENPTVSGATELNKQGQTTTLGSGKWTVGKDIKPGHYTITAISGEGNVMGETQAELNIMLSATPDADNTYLTSYDTYLFEDDKVDIEGLQSVQFTAVKKGKNVSGGQIPAGNYVVGLDIKPGRYKIKAVAGNGNLMTDDGEINEMFGTNTADGMYVNETTQDLEEGQVLTTDLNSISLTKE